MKSLLNNKFNTYVKNLMKVANSCTIKLPSLRLQWTLLHTSTHTYGQKILVLRKMNNTNSLVVSNHRRKDALPYAHVFHSHSAVALWPLFSSFSPAEFVRLFRFVFDDYYYYERFDSLGKCSENPKDIRARNKKRNSNHDLYFEVQGDFVYNNN